MASTGRRTASTAGRGEAGEFEQRHRLWAHAVNLALGCWLFASAFVLPRSTASGANAWIVGMSIVVFSLWSIWAPAVRRMNTAAALFLLLSAVFLPRVVAETRVHDALIACAVLALSLVRSRAVRARAYV